MSVNSLRFRGGGRPVVVDRQDVVGNDVAGSNGGDARPGEAVSVTLAKARVLVAPGVMGNVHTVLGQGSDSESANSRKFSQHSIGNYFFNYLTIMNSGIIQC